MIDHQADADFVRTQGETWEGACPKCGGEVVEATVIGDLPWARRYACAQRACGVTLVMGRRSGDPRRQGD